MWSKQDIGTTTTTTTIIIIIIITTTTTTITIIIVITMGSSSRGSGSTTGRDAGTSYSRRASAVCHFGYYQYTSGREAPIRTGGYD